MRGTLQGSPLLPSTSVQAFVGSAFRRVALFASENRIFSFLPVGLSSEPPLSLFLSHPFDAHPFARSPRPGRGCRAAMLISPARHPHFSGARSQRVRRFVQHGAIAARAANKLTQGERRPNCSRAIVGKRAAVKETRRSYRSADVCSAAAAARRGAWRKDTARGGTTRPSSARLHRWRLGLLTV